MSDNKNLLLDKQLVNAFIEGVINTLKTMANTDIKPCKPSIITNNKIKGDVAGIIGMVSGDMRGSIIISFSLGGVFHIIESMLGEVHTKLTPEVSDAVGELTNMIYGSAKTTLNKTGHNFNMAIPTVISGDFTVSTVAKVVTLSIPFEIKPGALMHVEVSVES